ncbi:MAG: hypothetical protein SH847_25675, partial [Roseiflexaceae bacterium]|nr:hypothetical protein [Roseiflexaceae bacterium]
MIAPEQQDPHFRSQRRIRLSNHQTQFGIDTVSLAYDPLRLIVAFVVPVNQEAANNLATILKSITVEHIVVLGEGGVEQNRVSVLAIRPDSIEPLHLLVNLAVDADLSDSALSISIYVLRLVNLAHVDPFFSQASFLLQTNSRSALDPRDSRASAAGVDPGSRAPQIDYLARDYSSFRQLMLNRLASQLPGGIEQQPADLSQALVEVIAYAADRLSYYQDAVATEAYLGTARRRISVRRHSRLIDYAMHEGCNARVWVQIQVQNTLQDALTLPVRTPLLTRALADQEPVLTQQRCDEAIIAGATIFETLHELDLYAEHQQMPLYDWGMREYTLPIGSTKAALKGHFPNLNAGQVIILKELVSPVTGDPADADPEHCLAVRLIEARTDTDALGVDNLSPSENGVPITWISWNGADALPFALVVATPNTASIASVSAARGNIVLADHGRSKTQVPLQPARVPANRRYRPWLPDTGISHSVAYDHPNAQLQPARTMLEQDPRQAVAAVQQLTSTTSGGQSQPKDWYVRRDLLDSDRFAQAFVIESEEDGRAQIRFGDGLHGRLPIAGETFQASYRIGNGQRGNIGRQTITSIAPNADSFAQLSGRVVAVTNPLPAQGGIDPEPIEQVRLYAPRAAHTQERCVVEQDYAAVA